MSLPAPYDYTTWLIHLSTTRSLNTLSLPFTFIQAPVVPAPLFVLLCGYIQCLIYAIGPHL